MKIPEKNHSHNCTKVAIFSEKEIVGAFADNIIFTNYFFAKSIFCCECVNSFFGNKFYLRESVLNFFTNIPFGEKSENRTAKSTLYIRSVFASIFKNTLHWPGTMALPFKNTLHWPGMMALPFKNTLHRLWPMEHFFKKTMHRTWPMGPKKTFPTHRI